MNTEIVLEAAAQLSKLPYNLQEMAFNFIKELSLFDHNSSDSGNIDSVWEEEITARVHSVKNGSAIGIDYDEAMETIEKKFAS